MKDYNQLKQYLNKLSKDKIIAIYLQKCYDQKFNQELLKTEILANIYNQIIDSAHHQLTIFDTWDVVIPQDKLNKIFSKGGIDESSNITG